MLGDDVDEVNRSLSKEENVPGPPTTRFSIMHKELDADDGELTRTLKVSRSFISDRYGPLVDALYDGSEMCRIVTDVTFEDGRKGTIEGNVKIVDMEPHAPSFVREAAE